MEKISHSNYNINQIKNLKIWASKMAQQIKVPVPMTEDLSLIPKTHIVKEKKKPP